jgi:hypothetical protein
MKVTPPLTLVVATEVQPTGLAHGGEIIDVMCWLAALPTEKLNSLFWEKALRERDARLNMKTSRFFLLILDDPF